MTSRQFCPYLFLLASLLLCGELLAQDPLFSQYTASPVYNNPALAGLYEGEVRLTANYRDQWSSVLGSAPLRTMAAAGELRYNVGGKDYLAVGVNVLRDEGGQSQFTQTLAGFGVTMQKYLSGGRGRDATFLGFGGRVGYGQNSLSPDGLWYSSNLDTTSLSIDPGRSGLPAGYTGTTAGYLDVTAGVNLAIVRRDYSLVAGLSAHHLNQPNTSFLFNAEQKLPTRYSALIGGEYLLQDELRLMPSLMVDLQGKSRRITAGGGLYYKPGDEGDAGFRFGSFARLANKIESGMYLEAIVLTAQVEFKRTLVGISYDVNTGPVGQAVDSRGAYELSITWTRAGKSRYKVVCPKF